MAAGAGAGAGAAAGGLADCITAVVEIVDNEHATLSDVLALVGEFGCALAFRSAPVDSARHDVAALWWLAAARATPPLPRPPHLLGEWAASVRQRLVPFLTHCSEWTLTEAVWTVENALGRARFDAEPAAYAFVAEAGCAVLAAFTRNRGPCDHPDLGNLGDGTAGRLSVAGLRYLARLALDAHLQCAYAEWLRHEHAAAEPLHNLPAAVDKLRGMLSATGRDLARSPVWKEALGRTVIPTVASWSCFAEDGLFRDSGRLRRGGGAAATMDDLFAAFRTRGEARAWDNLYADHLQPAALLGPQTPAGLRNAAWLALLDVRVVSAAEEWWAAAGGVHAAHTWHGARVPGLVPSVPTLCFAPAGLGWCVAHAGALHVWNNDALPALACLLLLWHRTGAGALDAGVLPLGHRGLTAVARSLIDG